MRRWVLIGLAVLASLVVVDQVVSRVRATRPLVPIGLAGVQARPPIIIGLIHSQTGSLAISEKSLIDAEILAIEEINARGGVNGRLLQAEIADGRSDPSTFASQAARLIERDHASVLVGGWTAECRKALVSVVERHDSLLIFPANFEGIDTSPFAIYSGGSANQVVMPAVRWCFEVRKAKRFFVVGSEEIWSRVVAEMAKDAIKAAGGLLAGEVSVPLEGGSASSVAETIRSSKADVVINVLVGDFNVAFYDALRRAGVSPDTLPVVGFNISEDELRKFDPANVAGHYAAWSYFQGLDRPQNLDFVRRFKVRYPQGRVVSDSMVAAYNGVILWSRTAAEAGSSEPAVVRKKFDRQSLDAAEGIVTIDPESRAAWRPFFLGKARSDGQFDVVWSFPKPIHPVSFVATRSRQQWLTLVDSLKVGWGGRWSSSTSTSPATNR